MFGGGGGQMEGEMMTVGGGTVLGFGKDNWEVNGNSGIPELNGLLFIIASSMFRLFETLLISTASHLLSF